VAIANQSSYSNAEIFSHAFKTLGHGTLVGMPTFGAVISTGGQRLIDGSYVRMPFRGWYVKGSDMNMENGPAVPDVEIENAPDSKAKGEDPQLKKAVEVLLEEIAAE
jgi:tricorn protease